MYATRSSRWKCAGRVSRRHACRGAVAIEFALVFLLFFAVFYAIVAYGLAFTLKQSVTMAAEEGARAAVQDAPDEATRISRAKAMANNVMSWLPGGGITVDATSADCTANVKTRCITVTVNYDYAGHPLVPSLPLFGIVIPANLGATATVQLG